MKAPEPAVIRWRTIVESLNRPYPVTLPMVILFSLIPFYAFIGVLMPGRTIHIPELALDRAVPLAPAWVFVYAGFYLFLIALPVFVVRHAEHLRRLVLAYLTVWGTAYVCFLAYPTIGPRPAEVIGTGFAVWGLRLLYAIDTPYNCLPSLHVAHSFVSALACYRVHRGVGIAGTVLAALVGLSTLYIKQHYILDVIAGIVLAYIAYILFLRRSPRRDIPEFERRLAPVFAVGIVGAVGIVIACFWVVYRMSGEA